MDEQIEGRPAASVARPGLPNERQNLTYQPIHDRYHLRHVDAYLDRINPANNAYITVARQQAWAVARRGPRGRLAGLIVSVKDNIDTAGIRTTYGSRRFLDHVPSKSAEVVARLENDGAIIMGKTNLDEFGNGVTGHNDFFGTVHIPDRIWCTPSGSSSGAAAAVAEGSCDLAVGTDSGGSIRLPASCCDLVGYKAAGGSMSMEGVQTLAVSFDSLGFIARDLKTIELALNFAALPGSTRIAVRDVRDLNPPPFPLADFLAIFNEEVWRVHGAQFELDPDSFGTHMSSQLSAARIDTEEPRRRLAQWGTEFRRRAQGVDVIVAPVLNGEPPSAVDALTDHREGSNHISARLLPTTCWVNALGWAALSISTRTGPIQLVARPGRERQLFAVARRLTSRRAEQ